MTDDLNLFIIDNLPAGLAFIEPNYKLKMVNKELAKILGRPVEDITGHFCYEEFFNIDIICPQCPLTRSLHSGKVEESAATFILDDGTKKNIYTYSKPVFNKDKTHRGFIHIIFDITEKQTIEEELCLLSHNLLTKSEELTKKNSELEAVNHELDDFNYSISHYLTEPIKETINLSEYILQKYGTTFPDEAKSYVENILESAVLANKLINDLLTISNLSKEKYHAIDYPQENLNLIIPDLKNMFRNRAGDELIIKQKLPSVRCSLERIKEVFIHLITNSLTFNDKDKIFVEIGYTEDDKYYHFYVKDNGLGIREESLQKVFKIFYRLNKPQEYSSTGVGLTIVKKIIENHNGRVWIDSKPGQGTTFYFSLPK